LAISKKRKEELVVQYTDWMKQSKAMILTEYTGLSMKEIEDLRSKVRQSGGEYHVIKNTLGKVAFDQSEWHLPENFLEGSTAIAFAFENAPATAKVISEYARESESVTIKGGYLEQRTISADEIKALADLPPLPVLRAQLLGVIMAPANKLARTLAEPARQIAAVMQAYADQDATTVTARS